MITNIIRYHIAICYIMSITRDRFRPYWVSSGGCKKHSIINMLKKQICHWVQKNAIQNNMIQQYLYHGGHIQGHTHMTCTTSHIGIAVSYCFVLHFFAPNDKFVFLACLLLSVFFTRLLRPNKVETGRGLLTGCNRLLCGTV